MSSVRVVSYNVLSSSLCEANHYTKCSAEDLDPQNRFLKISQYLELETQQDAVICLQEVSRAWCGPLQVFFLERGYEFSSSLYGNKFNDYMGIALAWPKNMKLKRLEQKRVGDEFPEAPRPEKKQQESTLSSVVSSIASFLSSAAPMKEERPFDLWQEIQRRYNTILLAQFEVKGKSFALATYHMPCLFGSLEKEQVMIVHAATAAKMTRDFADGLPFILAGDFNIKPPDAAYKMLTEGAKSLPESHVPPGQAFLEDEKFDIQQVLEIPLVSAYATKLGKEPELTNFAFNKFMSEPFVGTLDYIFLSSTAHWRVDDVKETPAEKDIDYNNGSFPNNLQPSDHVPVAADLYLLE